MGVVVIFRFGFVGLISEVFSGLAVLWASLTYLTLVGLVVFLGFLICFWWFVCRFLCSDVGVLG